MAKANFYVLATDNTQQRLLFANKLIEKLYRQGIFCYVLTDLDAQSRIIDKVLWTFRENSFVPHQCYIGEIPAVKTILIGNLPMPVGWQQTVLNLSIQVPPNLSQIETVLEIVDARENLKIPARQRYRAYQEAQFNLSSYNI